MICNSDFTLFTRRMGKDLFVCQIYVDDIIFGSTNKSFYDEFSKIMTDRFEMSMMGVLTFFLGFQIKQVKDETFISQTKYTRDIFKKFGMENAKPIKTTMILMIILILIWAAHRLIKRSHDWIIPLPLCI
jgi:O-glycosyl hydrolase